MRYTEQSISFQRREGDKKRARCRREGGEGGDGTARKRGTAAGQGGREGQPATVR